MPNTHYITALRFPLAVLVVLIHSYNSVWQGIESGSFPTIPYFCSRILPAFAVPLFFAISGYLFFLKSPKFSATQYTDKLKKRFSTLLIPYLLWNVIAFGLYAAKDLAGHQPLTFALSPDLLWGCRPLGTAHTNFLGWAVHGTTAPVLEPFWFVRDLIVIVLCSPVIYLLLRYLKFIGLLLIGAAYYLEIWPNFGGISLIGFWYFALGAWFSITDRDVIRCTKMWAFPAFVLMFPLGAFLLLYPAFDAAVRVPTQHLYVLCGMLFAVNFAHLCTLVRKPGKFLAQSSFFLYAAHTIVLLPLSTLVAHFAGQTDAFNQAFLFFTLPLSAVLICTFAFSLLQRFMPRYHYLLTGVKKS